MLRILIASFLLSAATAAAVENSVEIVLDSSKTMLRPVGESSIQAMVREAMLMVVAEAAARHEGLEIGLRTAGGGTEEARPCSATALVIEIDSPDQVRWTRTLGAIDPRGPRPLNLSVVAAIEEVSPHEGESRIVIVTTGSDECGSGPQEVAAAHAAAPHPVEIRIVGLNLDSATVDGFGAIPLQNATSAKALLEGLRWAILDAADAPDGEHPPEPTPTELPASVSASPQVAIGETFEVSWAGPESAEDFVSLAVAGSADDDYLEWSRIEDGNPIEFRAPATAGDYELRYVDGETGKARARAPLEVVVIPIGLKVAATATAGLRFEVAWTGPAAEGDFVAISEPESPAHRYLDWATTTVGSPISLAAPTKPGRYEVRYVTGGGRRVAAKTEIEVRP